MSKINIQFKAIMMLFLSIIGLTIILGVIVYVSINNYMYDDFFNTLKIRANTVAKISVDGANRDSTFVSGYSVIHKDVSEKLKNENDYVFKIEGSNTYQHKIFSDSLRIPISFFNTLAKTGDAEYIKDKILYKGVLYKYNGRSYYVIASAENYFENKLIRYLQRTLLFSIAIATLFALVASVYVSKNIFKPIDRITNKVKQISSENLHLRLDEERYNNELNKLIGTFNDMLNRIETSFETQNNFISNASHELRTPLTGIIGTADVCLSKIRSTEEYVETLSIILDEAGKLDRKTKALLFLAQTGFDGKVQKFEKVRIDQLLWDCIATIEKLDQKNKVHFDTSLLPENSKKLKVVGNEQLLHLAFTNIIGNGCKYSDNQVVHVSIGASNDKVFIVIRDTGIGIPKDELKYIYDPFFRASNTQKYEGYGIGLPLTRNIIRMHSGKITVRATENMGTTVQIDLPIAHTQ
ncbi:sensor histidine kinase [Taibaiella sp. KBW10]|uniref:sensor histidine kinase n=1 Tax=Taibaiella sp. KBW10 TaxID=2153357 RepID=UPI000F597FAD|nr:HAMP domain-containing sensor histidine kinase [Taibaiella sp. KBW10]RQO32513.1 sensor histidine kinase [Taibaiella sp. KBW10]